MESGVEFTAADFAQANRLTVYILAAVAQHEREMISQRTKAPWPLRRLVREARATGATSRL